MMGQQKTGTQLYFDSDILIFNNYIERLFHAKKLPHLGLATESSLNYNQNSSNDSGSTTIQNSDNTWLIIMVSSVSLNIICIVLLFFSFKKNSKLKVVNKEQIKEINYLKLFKINKEENAVTTNSDKDLNKFGILDKLMKVDKLYLNPSCNREMLIKELGIDKNSFSELLKKYRFDNLPDYINRFRLEESIRLLNNEEQLSIDQIAKQSGFGTSRSLQRQFKDKYNISPNEYRKLINKDKKVVIAEDL